MKKQVIAAAVASTLSVAALADISITGQMKSNYTHTDYDSSMVNDSDIIKTEGDLYVKGSNGDTSVVMNFSIADHITADNSVSTNNAIEDAYMTTKIGDVSLKVGQWDNGNNAMRASTRKAGKLEASTEMGGVGIKFATTNESDDELTLSTSIGGVSASFKQKNAGEDYAVSGTVAGINASYSVIGSDTANSDKSYVELSTSLGGVGVKYGKAEADSAVCLDGDTWLGDFEDTSNFTCHTTYNNGDSVWQLNKGQDITGLELSTTLQGNAVKFRTTSTDDLAGADTTYNKVIVTRPLASGTTFELTYTDVSDDAETTTDYNSLDLELAVKF
jgi:hypothetical protein